MREARIDLSRIIESRSLERFQGYVQARQVLVELRTRSRADDRNDRTTLGAAVEPSQGHLRRRRADVARNERQRIGNA